MTPYVLAALVFAASPSPTASPSSPAQGGDLAGCYSIQLGPWEPPQNLGQDVVIVTPPSVLEVTRERARAPFQGYFVARPAPGQAASILEFGFIRRLDSGQVEIVLSTGFSGLTIEARPVAAGLVGTAKTFWDFPRTAQTAQFKAKRIHCKPAK